MNKRYVFDYPEAFVTLPEYSARRGQLVEVVRPLKRHVEFPYEGEAMFRIRAEDGWEGDAWRSELRPR